MSTKPTSSRTLYRSRAHITPSPAPLAIWSRFSLPRRIALYRGANMFLPVSATGGGRTCCPSPQKGSACERRRRRIQRAGTGAAVETVSGQSRVRRFREPQGGREAAAVRLQARSQRLRGATTFLRVALFCFGFAAQAFAPANRRGVLFGWIG